MANDPTREAAFALLMAVFEQRRQMDDALNQLPAMDARDRAAGHRLAAAVLRRSGTLDAVLEPFLRKAPPDKVRTILRIGAAGLLLLDTPPHAAVATSVALARSQGLVPFSGLVNAVLRKVASGGRGAMDLLDSPRLDTPSWLWTSWGADARIIAEAHQQEAPVDLTIGPLWGGPRGGPRGGPAGGADGEAPEGGVVLPSGSVRFPPGTSVTAIPGFAEGRFWVQDAAASLPARLLAARPGERILDLCAAPGGKTAQIAATGAVVTALDRDPERLERLAENLHRWHLAATLIQADAMNWQSPELFDAVLLDAPCGATGTIRRHPDVPHLKRPRDIKMLAGNQDLLLAAAARMLKPGGRLIYAVCSLQPEEGAPRLPASGLRHVPFQPDELPELPEAITSDGTLRTHPGMWPLLGGMDGFFAARLVRD